MQRRQGRDGMVKIRLFFSTSPRMNVLQTIGPLLP